MKDLTESKITNILKEAVEKPLDYIEFFIYDHGVEAEPLILWVDLCEEEQQMDDIEAEEDYDDMIPDSVQEISDILLDLRDEYSITNIELKTDYDE